MKMTFQEIRIIATGPCIRNQLRDVNTICRRSYYFAAHIWKIYDPKIEVVPFIINFSTDLTTVVKGVGMISAEIGLKNRQILMDHIFKNLKAKILSLNMVAMR
jgi:hypothetical protein